MHILAAEKTIAGPVVRIRLVYVDTRGVADVSYTQTYVRPKVAIWTKGVSRPTWVRLPRGERITPEWAKAYALATSPDSVVAKRPPREYGSETRPNTFGETLDVEL